MTIPLRQSTASQEIPLGYFLDSTDGDTEETGLTIANTDIKLWKHGATTLANKNSGGATHISNGLYYAVLDATDTNTLGGLVIFAHVSGALAVKVECTVYPATIYDSMIAGTDYIQTDVIQIGGDTQSGTDLKDFADAGYDPATNKVQGVVLTDTCTTNTDMRGTDSAALAATALTNATWTDAKAGYLTAAVATATALATAQADLDILTGTDGATLATSQPNYAPATAAALSTMQGNVTDILADTNELQGDWTNTGRLDTILDTIATDTTTDIPGTITTMQGNITDILADTNELQGDWTNTGRLDTILDTIATDTTTDIPGTITTLQSDVTAIKAKTDNLPDGIKKNTAFTAFTFLMVDSADHVTGKTGLTVAGSYSGDGGAVASLTNTGAITEISNGLYEVDLTAGELNYSTVTLIFTASGADARVITIHPST